MPTRAGIPLQNIPQPLWPAGSGNPYDWVDNGNPSGFVQSSFMRGQPAFESAYQRRPDPGPDTIGQGQPVFAHSRPFNRGAQAFAPQFGLIPVNPIGSGVVATYKLPVIAGPGGEYEFAAIWFDVQTIPTSLLLNPTVPIETIDALLATSYVGGMIPTTG